METTEGNLKLRRQRRGTSMIELLVVIVVLLIGILGVIQVFPGGFGVIRTTRATSQMTALGRAESDRIKGRSAQLPEEIRATVYSFIGNSLVSIVTDTSIGINTLIPPAGDGMDGTGSIMVNAQSDRLGYWPYVSGANLVRRIIGEGGAVPAPRQVGNEYGGLMVLQFSPISYNPAYPLLLSVYGNDMQRREGDPGFAPARDYQFFVEDAETPGARLHVPRDRVKQRTYRLELTAWYSSAGVQSRDIETTITVAADPQGGYASIDIFAIPAVAAYAGFIGVEYNSVRLARAFDQVGNSALFTGDPYEYVLMDANLGVLLFNPRGYNYYERRQGGRRLPLVARVNYDVFDWRVIRDEFRVPDLDPRLVQLKLGGLKVGYRVGDPNAPAVQAGEQGPDGLQNHGIDIPVPRGNGAPMNDPNGFQTIDVILVDLDSGNIVLHDPTNPPDPNPDPNVRNDYLQVDPALSSYAVDKSTGMIRLLDYDRNAPGLQLRMIPPGTNVPVTITSDGRLFRALYQAKGEYAVQVMKAAARYRQTYGGPQVAEYYVGQSGSTPVGQPTRIYFPGMDAGKNVAIGEIWYLDSFNNVRVLAAQNYQIVNTPFDPVGAYVDIRALDPNAVQFDYGNGYAVRYVRGASVSVRVLWNPNRFSLGTDVNENWGEFIVWARGWRKATVETFLQKGDSN